MQPLVEFNASLVAPALTGADLSAGIDSLPWITLWSSAPEVQAILSTFPLLALGLVGLAIAAVQIGVGGLNRTFVDLFVAVIAVLFGGLFQIFNVLRSELVSPPKMSRPLIIAHGISLGIFSAFKFYFLYRRTQQPAMYETPVLATLPTFSQRRGALDWARVGGRASFGNGIGLNSATSSPVYLHSASYEKWGPMGTVVRVVVWTTIFAMSSLDSIWRIAFTRSIERFRSIYLASNALQAILLVFFTGKVIYSTIKVESFPRRRNFIVVLPLLFAMLLGFIVAILSLAPGLLQFSETPLGRFLTLIEVFIFLLEVSVQEHVRPIRDSFSFERPLNLGSTKGSGLAGHDASPFTAPTTPPLPERIVIRRGSHIPSWFTASRKSTLVIEKRSLEDGMSLAQSGAPPGRSRANSFTSNSECVEDEPELEHRGMVEWQTGDDDSGSQSPHSSHAHTDNITAPPSTTNFGSSRTSTSPFDLDADLNLSDPQHIQHPGHPLASKPLPRLPPRHSTHLENTPGYGTEAKDSHQSNYRSQESSRISAASTGSELSLSSFPQPPPIKSIAPQFPDGKGSTDRSPSLYSSLSQRGHHRKSSSLSTVRPRHAPRPSQAVSVTTEEGLEFDLLPPRPLFAPPRSDRRSDGSSLESGRPSLDTLEGAAVQRKASGGEGLNITSLIVDRNGPCANHFKQDLPESIRQRSNSTASQGSTFTLAQDVQRRPTPFPVSPVASEVEIRTASSVKAPTTSLESLTAMETSVGLLVRSNSKLRVDEPGRSIPAQGTANTFARTFLGGAARGLPLNPRRPPLTIDTTHAHTISPTSDSSLDVGDGIKSTQWDFDPRTAFERPRPAPPVVTSEKQKSILVTRAKAGVEPKKRDEGDGERQRSGSRSGRMLRKEVSKVDWRKRRAAGPLEVDDL